MSGRAQAVYVAGGGTLMGRGARWLLLDASLDRVPVERLWAILEEGPDRARVGDAVLAALEAHFDGHLPSLVLLGQTPGAEEVVVRGHGQVAVRAGVRSAAVGLPASGRRLPLVEGVVAAAALELAATGPDRTTPPAASEHPRAASPPELLTRPADRSAAPVRRPDSVPVRRTTPGPAVPRHLTRLVPRVLPPRIGAPVSPALPAAPTPPELPAIAGGSGQRSTPEGPVAGGHRAGLTVLAWRCPEGHPTPAHASPCRVCGALVPEQEPVAIPRPRLGGLRLPGGQVIPLDRGVVFGRKPEPVPGGEDWPHLVHLPAGPSYVSRVHLQIELDGWQVVARDLDSRGGTTVAGRGRAAQRLLPHEPQVLEPGQVLTLAEDYEVVFEVDPGDPGQARALRRTSR